MYQALYRKWRPQSFVDVVGQGAICDTLSRQVETGHISHAYLFSGSRGTGKTTCAKILSKAINCENPFHGNPCNKCPTCLGISSGEILDIVEIDAASNNGVDHVRSLREEAVYSPANAKYRVYIIDEVHMFSKPAFNALLKIMEEPPKHVVFILATTELHMVPATVASRCQRFIFKRISLSAISERLKFIARSEGVELSDVAADYIANLSDGAMRDALSLLDQCISMGNKSVSEETVESVVGLAGKKQTFELVRAIIGRDVSTSLSLINEIYTGGKNINSVLSEIAEILRDILISKTTSEELAQINARYTKSELSSLSSGVDTLRLCSMIEQLQQTTSAIAQSSNKRIDAEICLVRLCRSAEEGDASSLLSRISELEDMLKSGVVTPAKASAAVTEEKPKSAEKKPVAEEIKSPAVKTSAPVREEKPAPKAEPPAPASGDGKDIWNKILSAAKPKFSPGVFPLFSGVGASLSENILTLSSENAFVLQMLKKTENMNILREAAASVVPGITVTTGGVSAPEVVSGMDELLSGIGDFDGITIK